MTTTEKTKTTQLAQDFINGLLHPQEFTLEDDLVFQDQDLESIVMRYGHGDCHAWTVALTTACPELKVHYITLNGFPIHSFVSNKECTVAMDSNGVHEFDKVLSYWNMITTEVCAVAESSAEDVFDLLSPDEDEINEAYCNIAMWYEKTESYFKSEVASV